MRSLAEIEADPRRRADLAAPVQSGPPDGAAGLAIPVLLAWSPVAGALGYDLRVEETETAATIIDTLLPPDTLFAVTDLGLGEIYRWRVATRSACGVGPPAAGGPSPLAIAFALATVPSNGRRTSPWTSSFA
jgi:hypothetical protein